ncbi:hypothetical protein D8X55_04540 [Malacoplasma penetrans]|uniref:P35 lipoprotein homolog n=1 Tax=Malacoplasma penetrans (strain HF-2) TaxID=272633 RepID=Q8EV30_MALP2|nr:P35 family lipoprotein [Malacoplasma penetrans]RXY96180.1 hypothetical protein D8X55_04540 [Malacoplasma penetrans]BAC44531.1 P35 lipoprotein homolog [Malacoplasma penetrans HF-2]
MKIKKIKLLKALALTGAFGIVSAVPLIVSSCSSTDNDETNNNNNGQDNQGNTENPQNQKVTPKLKSSINFSGDLGKIYDSSSGTNRKTTDTLLEEEFTKNPDLIFTNAKELEDKDFKIEVDGGFDTNNAWTGTPYSGTGGWKTSVLRSVFYAESLSSIDITSLNDLKTKLDNATISKIITAASLQFSNTTYTVQNQLSLENGDLLHVNVLGTIGNSSRSFTLDLQIPISDLNLVIPNLSISVSGTDVELIDKQEVNLDFNIGINENTNFNQGATTLTKDNVVDADKALVALGYATTSNNVTTLNNTKISSAIGIYNCTFSASTVVLKSTDTNTYTINLVAKPNTEYVWEDGTNTSKIISLDVTTS